jgi:hypothetical protein
MKHSQKLVDQAHDLAFNGELSNKAIAKKLKLTDNQLNYILYQRTQKNSDPFVAFHSVLTSGLKPKKEPTITESFLDFFIADKFR